MSMPGLSCCFVRVLPSSLLGTQQDTQSAFLSLLLSVLKARLCSRNTP